MQYLPFADESKAISPLLWQTAEQTEDRSLYEEEIKTYVAECQAAFVSGKMSIDDDWDEFIGTLESMDLEGYLALMQEIIDANTH